MKKQRSAQWESPDVAALVGKKTRKLGAPAAGGATSSANAGSYTVPLGAPTPYTAPTEPLPGYEKLPKELAGIYGDVDYVRSLYGIKSK